MADTKRQQILRKNQDQIMSMIDKGYIPIELVQTAMNKGGKVSYEDQVDAFNQIMTDVSNRYSSKRLEDNRAAIGEDNFKKFNDFRTSMESAQNFKPSVNEWKDYDQNQMAELAESIGYNWANKSDRSNMMKNLQETTIKKDKAKEWKNFETENPIMSKAFKYFLAPSISDALAKSEDVETKDYIADAINAGTYLIPGFGAGKTAGGVAAKLLGNAAIEEANNIAQHYAKDEDLLQWSDIPESIGYGGMSQVGSEPIKKLAKKLGNKATVGSTGKAAGDLIEDAANYLFGETRSDKVKQAYKNLDERAKTYKMAEQEQKAMNKAKNAGEISKEEWRKSVHDRKPIFKERDAYNKHRKDLEIIKDTKSSSAAKQKAKNRLEADPDFDTIVKDLDYQKFTKSGKKVLDKELEGIQRMAQKGAKIATKGIARTTNQHINTKDTKYEPVDGIRKLIGNSDLDDYVGARMKGYNPKIPAKYENQKTEIDKTIKDLQLKKMMLGK